jgi:hypothetical protein
MEGIGFKKQKHNVQNPKNKIQEMQLFDLPTQYYKKRKLKFNQHLQGAAPATRNAKPATTHHFTLSG